MLDTNVLVVANGSTPHVSDQCRETCIDLLDRVRVGNTVLVDSSDEIMQQYLGNLSVVGQPGVGDAFFKWLWDNQGYAELLTRIDVHPAPPPQWFVEFPADPRLAGFDASDRVFVAVALASTWNPIIFNASDSDWWIYVVALEDCGIQVENGGVK